jgi:glycosyltransferase involved in cell wall biosynthesis
MPGQNVNSILMVHARSSWGGNTAMVLSLARELISCGLNVELAAHHDQPYIEPFRQVGITVFEIGIGGKGDMLAPFRLAALIRGGNYDIIHSHTRPADLAAYIAAKLTGKPLVITQHGNINLDGETLARRHDVFAFGYSQVLRGTAKIAAVCNATKRELIQECGVSPHNIKVIYNGIEQNKVDDSIKGRELVRRELGIDKNAEVVIITGSLKWKGHETLLDAVALIARQAPNLTVLIAGRGPQEPALRQQAAQLGISNRVHFLGFRQDIPALLSAADVFVLPSRSEAFPVSILEAMAAGLPVIASNIGGIPEQVQPGVNGYLINPCDAQVLARFLLALCQDGGLRAHMGQNSRETVRHFTVNRMVDGYLSLYKGLYAGR